MLNVRLLSPKALLTAAVGTMAIATTGAFSSAAPSTVPTAVPGLMNVTVAPAGMQPLGPISKFTVLHGFSGPDGAAPNGPLVVDFTGEIYGITGAGGSVNDGVIYKLNSFNGNEATVHNFTGPDGIQPAGGLINSIGNLKLSKNLFGVAQVGGTNNQGTLYEATSGGGIKVLHNFTGGADGSNPAGRLLFFTDGKLYGTTALGGKYGFGTVFSYDASGNFQTIYTFTGGNDGASPFAGLSGAIQGFGISPFMYGVTSAGGSTNQGVVFAISPSGQFKVLHTFAPATDGAAPEAELIPDFYGNLYGTATAAGSGNAGTVFEVSTNGAFKTLFSFPVNAKTGLNPKGNTPLARLAGWNGNWLYGSTSFGGPNGGGTIFKLSGTNLTTLHAFGGADGAFPIGQILLLPSGIYGTAASGGPGGNGEVFELPY